MEFAQIKYTPISITMKEIKPGIAAAPGPVCKIFIATMLLILKTNGAELAPQLKQSIAGTYRRGIPTCSARIIQIGNVANTATKPSIPPNVRIHSMMSMIKTATLACFSLSLTGITNLLTKVLAIESAAPLSVITFPRRPPRNTVGKIEINIPATPPTSQTSGLAALGSTAPIWSEVNAVVGSIPFVTATIIPAIGAR